MAKQRRAKARAPRGKAARVVKAPQPPRDRPPVQPQPPPRNRYTEAVTTYERGLEALRRHDYVKAAELLRLVLERFPEERELTERARLYLNVAERQIQPVTRIPRTLEERVYAATLALNAGAYDDAVEYLRTVDAEDPKNDVAQYMLAVAHTLRGEPERGLPHLRRAIELNPENRALARQDPDLEPIRNVDGFRSVVEAGSPPTRRRPRPRGSR